MADTIVVTACDSGFFQFASEMVRSLKDEGLPPGVVLGCMDLGLTEAERAWFADAGVTLAHPRTLLVHRFEGADALRKMGYLARPFLRENFPGHGAYIWMDADTWVQDPAALATIVATVHEQGTAFIHERERAYKFRPDLFAWKGKNMVEGYGPVDGLRLLSLPHVNNGVFGMMADAPHWAIWRERYQRAYDRTGKAAPHDQFGLNAAIRLHGLDSGFLPATFNWICDLRTPMFDARTDRYCAPGPDHRPIHVMHLAGYVKTTVFDTPVVGGGICRGMLRYGAERAIV